MQRPTKLRASDLFRVMGGSNFNIGDIVSLSRDDGTKIPYFKNMQGVEECKEFKNLEPYSKTIRYAQVGEVVVDKNDGAEYMVLERGKNTVVLSVSGNFKVAGDNYHFDELEKHFTLKAAPVEQTVLTMDQIAEKFGVEISKLKIAKE